ncbi:MAG: hypothetical protein RIS92_3116 [Verrucomicrobiota bacterium]
MFGSFADGLVVIGFVCLDRAARVGGLIEDFALTRGGKEESVEAGAGANGGVVFVDGVADDAAENLECVFAFGDGIDFLLSDEGRGEGEGREGDEVGFHGRAMLSELRGIWL